MKDRESADFHLARYLSVGIHPWFLTAENVSAQLDWLEQTLKRDPRVVAVGEAGLDKLCDTPYLLQMNAFREVIRLSESFCLPLFIHSVKSHAEIMALHKEFAPTQSWIIHGFRGKKELAESYLRKGFILSFGEKYHPEALQAVSSDSLLLETDESTVGISSIYEQAASFRKLTRNELEAVLMENTNRLFFSNKNWLFR